MRTARLLLRRFTLDDADLLVELDADPEVMRYLTGGRATPRGRIESETLPRFVSYYARHDAIGYWAVVHPSTEQFLGWCHFRPAAGAKPDDVELGYRFRKEAWGMGYATEVSQALIDAGFADQGIRRVWAATYSENYRSRRVMEKVGMRLVRTFRDAIPDAGESFDGDDVEYALTREEWQAQALRVVRTPAVQRKAGSGAPARNDESEAL